MSDCRTALPAFVETLVALAAVGLLAICAAVSAPGFSAMGASYNESWAWNCVPMASQRASPSALVERKRE